MRRIGFSTGALAYADFRLGVQISLDAGLSVIELSALRFGEWANLLNAIGTLDLSSFSYISIHLPSSMTAVEERVVASSLELQPEVNYPLILHPDAVTDWGLWREFGSSVVIENMDVRKPAGRTDVELAAAFHQLPAAGFCFDMGHARQVDPTMAEAYWILKTFAGRLTQIHVSEVNSRSKHDVLSFATVQSFQEIAYLIPRDIPVVMETPVSPQGLADEINKALFALDSGYTMSINELSEQYSAIV